MQSPSISPEPRYEGKHPSTFDLQAGLPQVPPSIDLKHPDGTWKTMNEINVEAVEVVSKHCGGNVSCIARTLGIGRSTLYRWEEERRPLPVHIG